MYPNNETQQRQIQHSTHFIRAHTFEGLYKEVAKLVEAGYEVVQIVPQKQHNEVEGNYFEAIVMTYYIGGNTYA